MVRHLLGLIGICAKSNAWRAASQASAPPSRPSPGGAIARLRAQQPDGVAGAWATQLAGDTSDGVASGADWAAHQRERAKLALRRRLTSQ